MKRLILQSLIILFILELIGSLLTKTFTYPYTYQWIGIYLLLFFFGMWTFHQQKRLLHAWLVGIPIALIHINIGGLIADAFGVLVPRSQMPSSYWAMQLLRSMVEPPVLAFWSLLGGFIYKYFAMEEPQLTAKTQ